MMNNQNKIISKSSLYKLESKILFQTLLISSFLFLFGSISFLSILFLTDFFWSSFIFLIYSVVLFFFVFKNLINLIFLNSATTFLDEHDLDINIYFKWIRKKIGNEIFYLFFTFYWLISAIVVHILIFFQLDYSTNNQEFLVLYLVIILTFFLQSFMSFVVSWIYQKNIFLVENILPWSRSFLTEIELTKKQARKDYVYLSAIILSIFTFVFFFVVLLKLLSLNKKDN